MDLKIRHIVLWPKKENLSPRVITFELTGINVITGQSQTGKSSLIPIVDYCLGSEKCAIPVGVIRDTTEWFGVVFQLGNEELLLARRNPGVDAYSNDIFGLKRAHINLPQQISGPNGNLEGLKDMLNRFAGLTNLAYEKKDGVLGFDGPPSFRDLASFEFQPQHIIANPNTLFFKADTFEHKKRLERILPLALGVIDNDTVKLKHALTDARSRLQQKLDRLEERKRGASAWLGELRGHFSRAQAFGLIPATVEPSATWENDDFLRHLRPIPEQVETNPLPRVERGATARAVRQRNALLSRESEIGRDIETWQRKLSRLERLNSSTQTLDDALVIQKSRLEGLGWFTKRLEKVEVACPMCGTQTPDAKQELKELRFLAEEAQTASASLAQANAVLDQECQEARTRILELEDQMQRVRDELTHMEERSEVTKQQRQSLAALYEFVGGLKNALIALQAASGDGGLASEVTELRREVLRLENALKGKNEGTRMEAALRKISAGIAHYASKIGVENPNDVVQLDTRQLTIYRISSNGRKDYLFEIGSGANWLGYHVSTMLALHELLIEGKSSPVPRFLIFDQPSQVYFPDRWPGDPDPRDKKALLSASDARSDDIARVHQIFESLADAVQRTNGALQLIVIDHADERTWNGIAEVHRIQRWRGDGEFAALIPQSWINTVEV